MNVLQSYIPIGKAIMMRVIYNGRYINTFVTRRPGIVRDKTLSITVHNTGNANSTAKNELAWLTNSENTRVASYNSVIYENEIIEVIPSNEVSYHAGKYSANLTSFGVEFCESGDFGLTMRIGAKYIATKIIEFGLTINDVLKHSDHINTDCPRILTPMWGTFIEAIERELSILKGEEMEVKIDRVLYLRTRGEDVKELQRILNLDGAGIKVDGNFGYGTRIAVYNFQRKYGLAVDGYVGDGSKIQLKHILNRNYKITKYSNTVTYVSFKKEDVCKMNILNSATAFETVKHMYKSLVIKPTLMINGGLFDMKTGNSASEFRDEGKLISGGYYSKIGLRIGMNGEIDFGEDNKYLKDFLGASPTLVIDNKINIDERGLDYGFIHSRHPRTAFAESINEYHLIIAHGRRYWLGHYGLTIDELANFCYNVLGSINAINFDGGGSCMMLDEKGKNINYPLEERGVDNSVCIYLK